MQKITWIYEIKMTICKEGFPFIIKLGVGSMSHVDLSHV